MDKLSAVLFSAIAAMVIISGIIIYNTWITDDVPEEVQEVQEPLVFNEDTSITNTSDRKLWLRVEIVYGENFDENDYQIESDAIDEGFWIQADGGWYYYREAIGFAQSTKPFTDRLLHKGSNAESGQSGKFRLNVEAVDEAWFPTAPRNGVEAFELFKKVNEKKDIKYL